MKRGPIFSPEDSDLAGLRWAIDRHGYAQAHRAAAVPGRDPSKSMAIAHRIVLARMLGRLPGRFEFCDHINGDPLDNRRENLRLTDPSGNSSNRKVRSGSGFLGVSQLRGRWQASMRVGGKSVYLGVFATPEEANAVLQAERSRLGIVVGVRAAPQGETP